LLSHHCTGAGAHTTVRAAVRLMMEHYLRHLLVEDRNGRGMVSAHDLLGAYASDRGDHLDTEEGQFGTRS
jgi:CBS domain-containing protein